MTVPVCVLSFTFAVILLWHCPITSSTVIFKCCQIVTGLPRTEERSQEHTMAFPDTLQRWSSSPSHRWNSLRNCSVKMMTQVSFTGVDEIARFTPHVPRRNEKNILF